MAENKFNLDEAHIAPKYAQTGRTTRNIKSVLRAMIERRVPEVIVLTHSAREAARQMCLMRDFAKDAGERVYADFMRRSVIWRNEPERRVRFVSCQTIWRRYCEGTCAPIAVDHAVTSLSATDWKFIEWRGGRMFHETTGEEESWQITNLT